jgi:ribA/ribD-fused uncharacterized protein
MRETNTHVFFYGGLYSQWAPSTFREGYTEFNCAEQYMMYHKAMLFGDTSMAKRIMEERNPSVQKVLGRKVANFNYKKWADFKNQIVYWGNYYKFKQNPEFMKTLLEKHTDKIIVEGSPTDRIWGVGLDWDDPLIEDPNNCDGQNLLGKAIMKVRDTFKNEN